MVSTNEAAWIREKHGRLEVGPAPYPGPGPGQVLVRAVAVAINPLDWIIQGEGNLTYGWLRYPTVLGADVAGEVVAVGDGVTRLSVGDRVVGLSAGTDRDSNQAGEGAFQRFVLVEERLSSPIGAASYEDAVTLPLSVATAAAALFQSRHLGVPLPGAQQEQGEGVVLVWGASTSVGSQAVRLAVAAGLEVVATASPRNFDYVRQLGAAAVLDYRSPSVEADIVARLAGRRFAGAVALGTTGAPACVRIAGRSAGSRRVAIATPPVSFASLIERGWGHRAQVTARLIGSNIALQTGALAHRVKAGYIWGSSIKHDNVGRFVFSEYLPRLLSDPDFRAAPEAVIAGRGLESIQDAMDRQRGGVSAQKLVVVL